MFGSFFPLGQERSCKSSYCVTKYCLHKVLFDLYIHTCRRVGGRASERVCERASERASERVGERVGVIGGL